MENVVEMELAERRRDGLEEVEEEGDEDGGHESEEEEQEVWLMCTVLHMYRYIQ